MMAIGLPTRAETNKRKGDQGDYLRDCLRDAGITQRIFASLLAPLVTPPPQITHKVVSQWVVGDRPMPIRFYQAAAEILGVPSATFATEMLSRGDPIIASTLEAARSAEDRLRVDIIKPRRKGPK